LLRDFIDLARPVICSNWRR